MTQLSAKDTLISLVGLAVIVVIVYFYSIDKDNTNEDDISDMLEVAVKNCDLERVKSLVEESKHLVKKSKYLAYINQRALNDAARNRCLEIVEFLLDKRAYDSINSALYGAVLGCQLEMVKFLLEKGADPNYRDWGGMAVWMIAENRAQYSWNTRVYREIADLLYEAEKNYKLEE